MKDDSFDCTLIAHLRIFLLFYRLLYCLILPENRLFFGIWKVVEIESAEEPILLIDCDHDLGDYAYDGGDGIKLLDWLAENERFYPIRLHTMNPVGRENMLRMIRRYW